MTKNWDSYKHIMINLYIQQGKKLDELRDFMERTHNFRASPRAYRQRFHRWGVAKYTKRIPNTLTPLSSGRFNARMRRNADSYKYVDPNVLQRTYHDNHHVTIAPTYDSRYGYSETNYYPPVNNMGCMTPPNDSGIPLDPQLGFSHSPAHAIKLEDENASLPNLINMSRSQHAGAYLSPYESPSASPGSLSTGSSSPTYHHGGSPASLACYHQKVEPYTQPRITHGPASVYSSSMSIMTGATPYLSGFSLITSIRAPSPFKVFYSTGCYHFLCCSGSCSPSLCFLLYQLVLANTVSCFCSLLGRQYRSKDTGLFSHLVLLQLTLVTTSTYKYVATDSDSSTKFVRLFLFLFTVVLRSSRFRCQYNDKLMLLNSKKILVVLQTRYPMSCVSTTILK